MRYKKELLIPRELIQKRIKEIARKISQDYKGKEPILIGILKGAVFFLTDLVRELTIPVKIDFIRVASYGSKMEPGKVVFTKDIELPIKDKPVIVVEDIVDTGKTLSQVVKILEEKGPESVRTCVLIDKTERREAKVEIDYCAFKVEKGFLIGYGLDFNEEGRSFPDIYVLKVDE